MPATRRIGLLGWVVQSALSATIGWPVRASTPEVSGSIVMQSGTGQTLTHRLQPTHSSSMTSNLRTPSTVWVIAWCEVSSQTMWQRPHLMHRSWSIRALTT